MSDFLTILLSFLGAVIGSIITIRLGYRELYAKNVTTNRMEWINVWRTKIPEFLSRVEILLKIKEYNKNDFNGNNDKYYSKILDEFYQAKYMIEIRLNLNESKHQMVYLLINEITEALLDCNECYNSITKKKEQLLILSRTILKEEWERVKIESKH